MTDKMNVLHKKQNTSYFVLQQNTFLSSAFHYRPISLTRVACKLLETGMKTDLLNHLLSNNVIRSSQHNFLSRKSPTTQLLKCFYRHFSTLKFTTNQLAGCCLFRISNSGLLLATVGWSPVRGIHPSCDRAVWPQIWSTYGQDELACQISGSKVISFKINNIVRQERHTPHPLL